MPMASRPEVRKSGSPEVAGSARPRGSTLTHQHQPTSGRPDVRTSGRHKRRRGLRWCIAVFAAQLLLHPLSAQDPAPPLPPAPRIVPVAPQAQAAASSGEDELIDRLEVEVRLRDKAMEKLGTGAPPVVPRPAASRPPEVMRAEQDGATKDWSKARKELTAALAAWEGRGARHAGDVLDQGRARSTAAQVAPLEASNLLAIAECSKDLAGSSEGTPDDLAQGLATLDRIDSASLADHDLPRALYLRLWFQIERLRRAPPAERVDRDKALAAAQATANELVTRHGDSPLARSAPALFVGLDLAATATETP